MNGRNPTAAANTGASPPGSLGGERNDVAEMQGSLPPPPAADHSDDPARLAKQGAEEARRGAAQMKESAKETASQAANQVSEAARGAAEQVRQQANNLSQQMMEKAIALFDQQRERAAEMISDCTAATRRAAEKLHQEEDQNLARITDITAERLDALGQYVRSTDARSFVHDTADLARRRPEWVLGGAFVVGLAISRFLKASRDGGAGFGSYRAGERSAGHSFGTPRNFAESPTAAGGNIPNDFGGPRAGASAAATGVGAPCPPGLSSIGKAGSYDLGSAPAMPDTQTVTTASKLPDPAVIPPPTGSQSASASSFGLDQNREVQ